MLLSSPATEASETVEPSLPAIRPIPGQRLAQYAQRSWLCCLLLALFAVAVHAPALSGQFIWDDQYLASINPFIKSPLFVFEVFRHHLFFESFSSHYRPIQNISFIFDYFVWNSNPYGFHLTNVLLHAASGVLLYLLLKRLLPEVCVTLGSEKEPRARFTSLVAFLIALLWVVHPVHSAAVDYISGRADSLAFVFAAGAWLLFIRARKAVSRKVAWPLFALAMLSLLLALCSRETACIWLALFVLYQFAFALNMGRRAKIAAVAGCVCVLGIYLALRQLPDDRSTPPPTSQWSKQVRAVLMLRALGDYSGLMIFPSNLHMERTLQRARNYGSGASWKEIATAEHLSIVGVLALAALAYGCRRSGEGRRLRLFGAAWFFIGFLPISNIVELNATVAEHWLYLPSVGFLIFLAGCALDLPVRWRKGLIAGACCAVAALGVRSAVRSSDWSSPEIFYQRTAAAGGVSARVYVNLAQVFTNRGEYAKAESLCRAVLATTPDYPLARNNLADVLYRQGRKEESRQVFAAATEAASKTRNEYPRTWIAALNLAHLYHKEGDDAAALALLAQARCDYPNVWELISFQSELLRRTEGPKAALETVAAFARDHWWHYGASLALGRLHAEAGDVEAAAVALRHASSLDVHEVEGLNLMAAMRIRQERLEDACVLQRRAVARQPDQPKQYLLLSDILEQLGRHEEARANVAQVERLHALAQASMLN